MLLNLYSFIKKDKYIEHPEMGGVSCSGFYTAFKQCNELLNGNTKLSIQCKSLFDISTNCYQSGDEQEFSSWLDAQISERKNLYKFLRENDSILPQLQQKHMVYDLFINLQKQDQNNPRGQNYQNQYQQSMKQNHKYFQNDTENENSN